VTSADDPALERVEKIGSRLGPLRSKLPLQTVTVFPEELQVDPSSSRRLKPQVSTL
jgi:hypothetical protein